MLQNSKQYLWDKGIHSAPRSFLSQEKNRVQEKEGTADIVRLLCLGPVGANTIPMVSRERKVWNGNYQNETKARPGKSAQKASHRPTGQESRVTPTLLWDHPLDYSGWSVCSGCRRLRFDL